MTLIERYTNHIAITGYIYINMHGLTSNQETYNKYAPILMTSVDTDPILCSQERTAILQRLGVGKWQIFGAHGFKKDYPVIMQLIANILKMRFTEKECM